MNKILQFLNWMFSYLSPLGRGAKGGVGIHTDKNTIIATQPVTLHNQLSNINRKPSTNFFFLLFTVYCSLLTAQNFPVQVIPQAIPPAPIYVSDYADASTISSPLRVQIILNDFEIANREIRLKTYFTGSGVNFQSNDIVVGASPLFLEGGVPLVLTNVELAPYFEFNNISGISPNQYGNAIPEGAYQFCVEVYDVLTGSRLSNKSCAVSVVFQNEPPFLVLPRNKINVDEVNPQYIVFQWTPRSINVSNVEYELSLVEIWDNQVDPQQAFLSSPPIFQTTTSATTYIYGPSDLPLLSGKNYAWRIQAKAKQGTEEIGLFKNQGNSEIFSFSYAGSCDLPLGVNHEVKGSTNANIVWDDFSTEIPEYTVRYRQKGNDNEWFESKTAGNLVTIWDLKPGTRYEYQLRKKCSVTESDWSFEKEFTTFIADDEDSVYDCNISPDFDISNQELLPNMGVGDKFTAGDFPITVLEVNGSNGRFNGKGYVTIPYLSSIKVAVQFTNIAVNTEKQLFEGEVITIYDPTLSNILDIDEAIDTVNDVVDSVGEFFEGDNDLDEIQVDWTIGSKDEITIEDGMVVITNPYNGVTKKEPLGDDMVITDQEGNTYYVSPEGEITEGGQITPGEEVNPGNVSGVSNNGDLQSLTAENIIVKFNSKGTYGFDKMPEAASADLKKEYKTIKDVNDNDYVLAHHAVKNGGTTQIQATIEIQNNAYTPDQVVFKNKQGKIFTPTAINGNTATISLDGVYSFENETIYAVVPSKEDANQQLTAGAFTLWHLAEKTIDVAIVSVGASVGDVATAVNGIFRNGLAKINFKNTISVDVNAARTALGANGMDVGESPFTAAYNDEQKALRALAKSAGANNSDTYYLIVLGNEFSNTKGIAGFMPLQRQFGFVFEKYASNGEEGKGSVANTVAHEIGHGIFALQHPFSQHGMDPKDTDWLMDYGVDELVLPHTHWSQMHDPAIRFYVFQDEEDGQSTRVGDIPSEFKNSDDTFTFMTLNGSYITLPEEVKDLVFVTGLDELNPYIKYPTGALMGFTIKDEIFKVKISGNKTITKEHIEADFNFRYEGFESKNTKQAYIQDTRKNYSNAVITFSPRYGNRILLRTQVPDLSFSENTSVNILQKSNNDNYSKIYEGTVLASIAFKYQETTPYDAGYIVNEKLVGDILGDGIDWNFSYPVISKIAMLNNSYPAIIKRVFPYIPLKKDDTSGSFIGVEQAHVPLKTLNLDELNHVYLKLLNAVTNDINDCSSTFEDLSLNSSAVKVQNCIKALSDDEIKQISVESKTIALSLMLENWKLDDQQEIALIRLLKFTKENEVDALLENLNTVSRIAGAEYNLLRRLVYKTDNDHTYFHEDNYKELINVLATLCVKNSSIFSSELQNLDVEELLERNITFYYKGFWDYALPDLQVMWSFLNGQDIFTYDTKTFWQQENESDAHIKIYNQQYIGNEIISESEHLDLHPFSPIFFTNKSGLSLLSDYNKDTPVLSPAILAFYADDIGDTKTIVDGIEATVDVVSLATGYGALVKAPSLARKTFVIADMVGSGVSLTTNIVGYENFSPETKTFVDALNILTATIAVTDAGSNLKNLKNIFRQVENIREPLPSMAQANAFLDALIAAEGKLANINSNTDKIKEARIWLAHLEMEANLGNIDNLKPKINTAKSILLNIDEVVDNVSDVNSFVKNTKVNSWLSNLTTNIKKEILGAYLWLKIETTTLAKISENGVFTDVKWIDKWVGEKVPGIPELDDVLFEIKSIEKNGNLHLIREDNKITGLRYALHKTAHVDQPLWRTTYKNIQLTANPDKVTTIVGKWSYDTGPLIDELGPTHWNMFTGQQPRVNGKFNLLNIDLSGRNLTDQQIWDQINEPWLREAMENGDDIIIATDPIEFGDGFFKRELDFIQENASKYGYDFAEGVSTGKLVKNLANGGNAWLNPSLLNKLDGFNDALLKQKFLDDFASASTQTKSLFNQNPKLIDAWKKLDELTSSPSIRQNIDNLKQRSIIDEYANIIANASNARKGNFGEIGADLDLNGKDYESLISRIDDIDDPGHNGIDGVYRAPDGSYIIVEGKYTGSASLNSANESTGLDRQMSDPWIEKRLSDAVGPDLAQDIIRDGYKRVLAKVASDGTVSYQYVSSTGYLTANGPGAGGTGPFGIFDPLNP